MTEEKGWVGCVLWRRWRAGIRENTDLLFRAPREQKIKVNLKREKEIKWVVTDVVWEYLSHHLSFSGWRSSGSSIYGEGLMNRLNLQGGNRILWQVFILFLFLSLLTTYLGLGAHGTERPGKRARKVGKGWLDRYYVRMKGWKNEKTGARLKREFWGMVSYDEALVLSFTVVIPFRWTCGIYGLLCFTSTCHSITSPK